jgi:hypothetical protein
MAVADWPRVRPKREIRFASRCRAPPLPPLRDSVAGSVAPASISACSRIGSAPVPRSLRRQAHGRGHLERSSLVKTRRPPCARSDCRGKPSASQSGRSASTLIRKVPGLRRYYRLVHEAAMMKMGTLGGGEARCISPHVFAVSRRSGRLLSALRPMAPTMPIQKDHEKDVEAEAWPRSYVKKMADAATGDSRRQTPPRGRGPNGLRPNPKTSPALNPAPSRHYSAWP